MPKQVACQYWVQKSTGVGKKLKAGIQCGKICDEGTYCPKHQLTIEHEAGRFKRAGEASARSRAHKADMDEVLKHSPLAAVNPNYKGKHDGL